MPEARTVWAIALLLAPTGAVAAGTAGVVAPPAQHTAYVQITIDGGEERQDLASVEARVTCMEDSQLRQAMNWLVDRDGCTSPAGAAVYVSSADAPSPTETSLAPTGTVYAYEDGDRVWRVQEYVYAGADLDFRHHAYVLTPDISDRVANDRAGEPARGVVDLAKLGAQPGQTVDLEATLGSAPELPPSDPSVERVRADETPRLGSSTASAAMG
jgi:hypothetical protein